MQPDAIDWTAHGWRLAITAFLVLANGFFVSAEFALVKVRRSALDTLAEEGSSRARIARHLQSRLDEYLSACQLGITIASLVLGWIAEPAVADLLLAAAPLVGLEVSPASPLVHGVAITLALTLITVAHMTLGEQAPKLWGIHRAEQTALAVAVPLRGFALVFKPFIWTIYRITDGLLRLAGLTQEELSGAASHSADELRHILDASAKAGHISDREHELAQNVLGIMELEVRHILLPRVDVELLSLQRPLEQNLEAMRKSGHSRFPLCEVGLDSVIGIVHAKQVLADLAGGRMPDLQKLARRPVFASDTQPLSRFILQMQRTSNHCSVVLDEHGTAIGLAFLEDAIEEIVGPIHDEFDQNEPGIVRLPSGGFEIPGNLALPEAAEILDLELNEDEDTIGGVVVARLGRLPRRGDEVPMGQYQVTVHNVVRHRIDRLRFEPKNEEEVEDGDPKAAGTRE
jgi:CBS domain containing-hemolysin-like protein